MLDLNDFQFEILPDVDLDTNGVGFGLGLNVSVDKEGFDPGTAEWTVQDTQNPANGATQFGRDQLAGPTWAWNAFVNEQETADALVTKDAISKVWRARAILDRPGATACVRYQLPGRTRRIYGRPRRFNAPPNNLLLNGYIPVTMDFKAADSLHYDDVEQSVSIGFVVASDGGLVFPVTFPYSSLPDSHREGAILVGGDSPTYPIIRIDGPILNPSVQWAGRVWGFTYDLQDGDWLEIDTRPWKQTILRNGQYNASGAMNRRQYMRDMTLEPGGYEVAFRGQSSSGTALCTFRWRNAFEGY